MIVKNLTSDSDDDEDEKNWKLPDFPKITTKEARYLENVLEQQLHKILWVVVSSTVGLRGASSSSASVCLQDVVLVNQTNENRLGLNLDGQCYSIHLTAQT
ncbi:hypothetical protein AVEN_162094-1 [Araneus ventricosus]|uniref:Uncharacterized protein n=1 Tax=Araneus ventricosus TaxID=182803 RepID=A0A4Y2LHU0_ARAVE|nr:hypothetical protein AVEN_162094-1 [Araneus ventricosus]